jgi:hypothetical protein
MDKSYEHNSLHKLVHKSCRQLQHYTWGLHALSYGKVIAFILLEDGLAEDACSD